jgi:hypothetical protein
MVANKHRPTTIDDYFFTIAAITPISKSVIIASLVSQFVREPMKACHGPRTILHPLMARARIGLR